MREVRSNTKSLLNCCCNIRSLDRCIPSLPPSLRMPHSNLLHRNLSRVIETHRRESLLSYSLLSRNFNPLDHLSIHIFKGNLGEGGGDKWNMSTDCRECAVESWRTDRQQVWTDRQQVLDRQTAGLDRQTAGLGRQTAGFAQSYGYGGGMRHRVLGGHWGSWTVTEKVTYICGCSSGSCCIVD